MLDELNILVVEDEALIAMEVAMSLEDEGAEIVGPCSSVATALTRVTDADAAVLDVDVRGEAVFPVADELRAAGKPFLFHTGRDDLDTLRDRYGADVPIIRKPSGTTGLSNLLAEMVRRKT
ncbi:hypothetical protein ACK8OR_06940 [Jannaschia sp. KMU-145]|uniref:hypothetical protein n=1 Tax=Jannaschia halovivens TaxID=3388667 RepID=UPI00396AF508